MAIGAMGAIVAAGKGAGLTTHGFAKIDEIPYDFLRRRLKRGSLETSITY
jgi:hypothetical protein